MHLLDTKITINGRFNLLKRYNIRDTVIKMILLQKKQVHLDIKKNPMRNLGRTVDIWR